MTCRAVAEGDGQHCSTFRSSAAWPEQVAEPSIGKALRFHPSLKRQSSTILA
ncbi:MAG TPA: hypothetical protein VKB33_03080 [Nitrospira sp.]|nr:hypothetical protein [Nitrospira sp.]